MYNVNFAIWDIFDVRILVLYTLWTEWPQNESPICCWNKLNNSLIESLTLKIIEWGERCLGTRS